MLLSQQWNSLRTTLISTQVAYRTQAVCACLSSCARQGAQGGARQGD